MSTLPVSVRRMDGGHIKGAQPCRNTVEIRCIQTGANGKQASFAVHGSFTTVPTDFQALANQLFTAISGNWNTNLASLMMPAAIFSAVHIRNMASPTNPVFVSVGTAVPGSATGNAMPAENAIVITENVAQRGRGLKGRIYLGGWGLLADSGAGVISPAADAACRAFAAALFTNITSSALTPAVAQLPRAAYIGLTGATHLARVDGPIPVQNYTLRNDEWDTQRRRGLNG